jgi:hypothetical protein
MQAARGKLVVLEVEVHLTQQPPEQAHLVKVTMAEPDQTLPLITALAEAEAAQALLALTHHRLLAVMGVQVQRHLLQDRP